MKKIWLMRFTSVHQTETLRHIANIPDVEVLLTTVANYNMHIHHDIFENCKTLVLSNNSVCSLDSEIFKQSELYKNESIIQKSLKSFPDYYSYLALQILDRFERFEGEISFDERNQLIEAQYLYWANTLEEKKPDYVFFADIPHMYYELILLGLLKSNNIKTFIIGDLARTHHFYMDNEFRLIPNDKALTFSSVALDRMNLARNHLNPNFDHTLNKNNLIDNVRLIMKKSIGVMLFKLLNTNYKIGYYIKQGIYKFGSNKKSNELYNEIKYLVKCIIFPIIYNLHSSSPDFEEDYIYLPLQSGFENTVHPNVSPLSLFQIIKYAISVLKPNQFLYIKEHPAQFRYRAHQRFSRDKLFYKKLIGLDRRIRLIDSNVEQSKLIANSSAVITINVSSAFIEARGFEKTIYCIGSNYINGDRHLPFTKLNGNAKYNEQKFFYKGSIWEEELGEPNKLSAIEVAKTILLQMKSL